jgi:hypothetical protein
MARRAIKVAEPAPARSQETAAALATHPALAEQFRRGEIDLARFAAVQERTCHLADPAQVAEVDRALAEVAGLTPQDHRCGRQSRPRGL